MQIPVCRLPQAIARVGQWLSLMMVLSAAAAPAFAQEGYYLTFRGGVGDAADADTRTANGNPIRLKFDSQYLVGGAFGYEFHHTHLRLEGEYSYLKRDIRGDNAVASAGGFVTNQVVMGNLYYDFVREKRATPYVGGGLGISDTSEKSTVAGVLAEAGDTVFAYQAKAGVEVKLIKEVALGVGYRFLGTGERTIRRGTLSVQSERDRIHLVEFALRFNF